MGHNINSDSNSILSESGIKDTTTAIETVQNEKQYKCTFTSCNLAFSRPSRLQRHIRFHTGERCYKCNYPGCDKAYMSNCHLKRHTITHSIEKTLYKCPECTLSISSRHNLKRHYNVRHKDIGKLTCKVCDKIFTKKYQFKTHMVEHGLIGHKCNQCGKQFKTPSKLKRHTEGVHAEGGKKYPCTMPECNEVFGKWLLLCAHIKTQHVQDHKCEDCGKVFLTKKHLKIHSKVHIENRSMLPCPYDKCPRAYRARNSLTHHVRTYHLGEKYECDVCKIKIGTKQKLRHHIIRLHMSETRIKQIKKLQRKKRKDTGTTKRSVASKLVGVNLPSKIEKMILEKKEDITYLEQFIDNPDL